MKRMKMMVTIAVLGGSAWLTHAAGAETPKKIGSAPAGKANATRPVALPEPAPDKSILTGPVNWTGISGYTAPNPIVLPAEGKDFMAAYSIQWWEDGDEACKFKLYTRQINKGTIESPEAEACSDSPGSEKWVARRGPHEYITALQVCTTDKKDTTKNKLKGIRLWGRILNPETGALGPVNTPEDQARPHCKKWHPKVECPDGEVATAITVYSEMGRAYPAAPLHSSAKGISLGCRKVQPKP